MIIIRVLVLFFLLFSCDIKSEDIGHECGLSFVRLRKPLSYYKNNYSNLTWGAHKLCLLIEEQRNRGQDGAGMAVMKFDIPHGQQYFKRIRYAGSNSIDLLLNNIMTQLSVISSDDKCLNDFLGEIYLGHVRYGTSSSNNLHCCQPYVCKNSIASKSFMLAGNFNITNSKDIGALLNEYGLTLTSDTDTQIILELLSYYLNQEQKEIDIAKVLHNVCTILDGGYVFAGVLGNGDAFICRDPAGIRPGFFYIGDDVIAAASERTALINAFDIQFNQVQEIKPGHVLVINRDGSWKQHQFMQPLILRQCSFERIYFSKATDPDIYHERKLLGKNLALQVLQVLGNDIESAIFTYVPNSGEVALIGLIEELHNLRPNRIIRVEKLIYKNQRLRTFIVNDNDRCNLVARLYTMTKGIITCKDTLVVVDDSIVRGTTLRESIIKDLARLNPKRIIFISSAPPVYYPDGYGIDMSQLGSFVAFQAVVELAKQENKQSLLEDIKNKCINQMLNPVKKLYEQFSVEQIAAKIVELSRPDDLLWDGQIQIIYQTIEGLHNAMPNYLGDWYFTGNYPTSGGYKVLNTSYLQWYYGSNERAY